MATSTRLTLCSLALLAAACSSDGGPDEGDTSFISSPPGGGGLRGGDSAEDSLPPGSDTAGGNKGGTRAVEETDIYRLDGDRLYFLNAYRGLMVFDMHDVDHPRLLGRAPIYGSPVEMVVRNGRATVVVADWYGTLDDGSPFHGSVVRGYDATDPTKIRQTGEARLGGWVSDTRVVGDVLYAVSTDYGWYYGLEDRAAGDTASTTTAGGAAVIVSSVSFGGGEIKQISKLDYPGWGGIFHVTASAVLLAHDKNATDYTKPGLTELEYLDISDPGGAILPRGRITVEGRVQGWGADNGRWNLDFADGKTAHIVACAGPYWGCYGTGGYVVSTVDFSNPAAPKLASELDVPSPGWSVAARFDGQRLYLTPTSYGYDGNVGTPFLTIELGDKPRVAGTATVPGMVWNLLPGPGETMFALGNDWGTSAGDSVTLSYLDVTAAGSPKLLGTARFGEGWAWTPAAGTFKAFTLDEERGLVVVPFSGWSETSQSYRNGLQLIEIAANGIHTAGAATTRGWVSRGIFVQDRLVALSDVALSVVDFAHRDAPLVTAELTLARNVIAAEPTGDKVATVATDFWDQDVSESEVRLVPTADVEELEDPGDVPTVKVAGTSARVFRNGDLAYVVTDVRVNVACQQGDVGRSCAKRAQQVQVVDLSGGKVRLRGKVRLPEDTWR